MPKINEIKIPLSNYRTFYEIAHSSYSEILRIVEERESRTVKDDDDIDFICEKNAAIERAAMVTVVFSAFALEGFINDYGITRFSGKYFDNHLDKLNTTTKWLIIPQLSQGKSINTDGQAYEMLKNVFKLRDRLVHSKTKMKEVSALTEEDWVREEDAYNALKTVQLLIKELSTHDTTIDLAWVEEVKKDLF